MIDGYPEEDELEMIRCWDPLDFQGLFDYLKDLWYYPDYIKQNGRDLEIHTGGWSGNEEIMGAVMKTMFWYVCWVRQERGGHYYLMLPSKH
jgi:hypothetical protein